MQASERRRVWILVTGYDCAEFIARCLASVYAQDYDPISVVVTDDASPDQKQRDIVQAVNEFPGWRGMINAERVGATANLFHALQMIEAEPLDLVVILDADDWLNGSDAVSKIVAAYDTDPFLMAAYGSYVSVPHDELCPPALPYPPEVIATRTFRTHPEQRYNHPLTALNVVWQQLTEDDCRDDDGSWVMWNYDACMYPCILEWAGPNHRCLTDCTYVYRSDNPDSCNVGHRDEMLATGERLAGRPKKPMLHLSDNGRTVTFVETG